MRPLIVVTGFQREVETTLPGPSPQVTVHRRFGDLVARAGGLPLIAEPAAGVDELLERTDAIVINGGGDVRPQLYGAEPHPELRQLDDERDRFELALVRGARERGLPVLGVCRGLHVLNVALGGTLIQHLPDVTDFAHDVRDPYDQPAHPVRVAPGSWLAEAIGATELGVNTLHHQAVDRLADDLRAVGWAPDGTVEAVESTDGRALGVQWHPELMDPAYDEQQLPLFEALVEAAGGARPSSSAVRR